MVDELNVVIAGVSGQGIVMVARVLASALLADGHRVISTESLALTHRNAPTFAHLRVGRAAHALKIPDQEADLLIAFEANEGMKLALAFAKEGCRVILNSRIIQRGVSSDEAWGGRSRTLTMPAILATLRDAGIADVTVFDGSDIAAKEVGRLVSLNMVMLGAGAATGKLPVKPETVEQAIVAYSPRGSADRNLKAFRLGLERFREQVSQEKVAAAS